jgi:hypothetical protein
MIRTRLIHWLGGRTQKEYLQCLNQLAFETHVVEDQRKTITELQALIPVSAVTPGGYMRKIARELEDGALETVKESKKKGRPKKGKDVI